MLYSLREGLPEAVRHFLPHKGFYLQQNWEVIILDDGRSWCIILSVLFFALGFFFSAAETAVPGANEAKLREQEEAGDEKARRLSRVRSLPRIAGRLHAAGAACAACSILFGTTALFPPLYRLFLSLLGEGSRTAATMLAMVLAGWAVTVVILSAAVMFPRAVGERFADRLSRSLASLLPGALWIVCPITAPAAAISWLLSRPMGNRKQEPSEAVTEEEIRMLVDTGSEMGFIEESQKEMINNIFEFDDTTAGDVMTHRTEVMAVEKDAQIQEVIDLAINEGFSRLPVYEGDMDNILGFIYVKDLLCLVGRPSEQVDLSKFIRPVIYVPEHLKCRSVFAEFKKSKTAMAVVVDEHGGTEGILTMEDILESIVGDIEDEYDEEEKSIQQVDADTFLVEGTTDLEDLGETLDISFEEDEDYDTLGGFLTHMLGRIPKEGENPSVVYEGYRFTVLHVEERRVARVRIQRIPRPSSSSAEPAAGDEKRENGRDSQAKD